MKDPKEVSELKIVVFGEPAVGKSALTIRYTKQKFEDIYEPTIEDTYPTNVVLDGRSVELSVVDTAGHGIFCQMRESYIKSGDGFLLVYSVTDKESFSAISAIREQILSVKGEKGKINTNTAMVLVGNKCDLDDDRQILYQEGDRLARQFSCPFFETSAKDDVGVEDVFIELTRKIKRSKMATLSKHFARNSRMRFSMRSLSINERKCKEKLQALKGKETSTDDSWRRRSFRRFICGTRTLGT
ncbi:ras-like protein 1 [Actinia tenebrosa]|uniref:Ras-like protein 1 n=1 Tax=Actinia tenebrosa TaxID=6105 RepID=A0A6P8IHU7_ACTTE|nr:ras-like protein 1 [Actinia tenebrosa]